LISLSFDPVLRDIFLPLITGATLCLPDDQIEPASERILSWLDRQNITVLNVVPTLAQTWLGYPLDGVSLRSLRWAFFAGEALPEPLVRRWREAFPEVGRIVNLYGPTETTLAKCFQVVPDEPIPGVQSVGMPLPQTQALVCNQSGQLCGIGERGEIVLRTPFRTFGYINAPEDQQRRFVKNPFRDDAYDLVYYTGDRGRYCVDGSLEIIGRLDDQVKIRGVRVEPEEILAQLNRHPGVESCVVLADKDVRDENCLVAYVVASNRGTTGALLQAYLSDQLPAALIPASFVFLDSLPLSPNGKVDRRALPKPAGAGAEWGQIHVAPRTHFEEMLANIWAEILKLDQVGIHDNFFHLGGHSLLATQFVSRVRNSFKCDLPLRTLFEAPTIQGLAQRLQEEVEMAAIIEQHRQMQATDTETEQLLSEVESMTEEQAQNQLAPSEPK
jgi:acyl-coenzyme A synthetase/AMP-(fatty) acid ligase/acyl carrier protein